MLPTSCSPISDLHQFLNPFVFEVNFPDTFFVLLLLVPGAPCKWGVQGKLVNVTLLVSVEKGFVGRLSYWPPSSNKFCPFTTPALLPPVV